MNERIAALLRALDALTLADIPDGDTFEAIRDLTARFQSSCPQKVTVVPGATTKIQCVKAVRFALGLMLKEALDVVEGKYIDVTPTDLGVLEREVRTAGGTVVRK